MTVSLTFAMSQVHQKPILFSGTSKNVFKQSKDIVTFGQKGPDQDIPTETPKLGQRYKDALSYAFDLHNSQVRKGSDKPYMLHLVGVSSIALEYADADEDEAIAALLHDAVEDQGGPETLKAIREKFGDRVADIVAGCTDADTIPKPPWKQRKEAYIAHLNTAPESTLVVSASDKLFNVRSILFDYHKDGEAVWARFKGGKEGTLWYYQELVKAFEKAQNKPQRLQPLINELRRMVQQLTQTVSTSN